MVHTSGRGLLWGWWWPVGPKLVFDHMAALVPEIMNTTSYSASIFKVEVCWACKFLCMHMHMCYMCLCVCMYVCIYIYIYIYKLIHPAHLNLQTAGNITHMHKEYHQRTEPTANYCESLQSVNTRCGKLASFFHIA
jgi:hypothetical protein